MRPLLGGVALAALIASGVPAPAQNPAPGMAIIPPANPAAAQPAASPPPAQAAASAAAPVAATAIRHDRPLRRRYAWHRRRARHRRWWRGARSDRVAETLNLDELRRMAPPASPH